MVICGSNSQTSCLIFLIPSRTTKIILPIKNNSRIKGTSAFIVHLFFSLVNCMKYKYINYVLSFNIRLIHLAVNRNLVTKRGSAPGGCLSSDSPIPSCLSGLGSWLGAWGDPMKEFRQDQVFFVTVAHESRFVHGSHIKMTLCQILPDKRLDKHYKERHQI